MTSKDDQNLFCRIGDVVEITHAIKTNPWPDAKSQTIPSGTRYKAVALTGYGWDLKLIKGNGPEEVRILNSEMHKYLKRIGSTQQGGCT